MVVILGWCQRWCLPRFNAKPFFFAINNFDLSSNLQYNLSYALGTRHFSYVKKPITAVNNRSSNLKNMSKWAFQWEISFNSDLLKPAEQVIFSKETTKPSHSEVFSNSVPLWETFRILCEILNMLYPDCFWL